MRKQLLAMAVVAVTVTLAAAAACYAAAAKPAQEKKAEKAEKGEIREEEVTVEASTLPKAVTEALQKRYPKGKITLAEKLTTKDGTAYELRVAVDKKTHIVTISPTGKVKQVE